MKKTLVVVALALVIVLVNGAVGQTSQAERKAFREYTSPQELVSIAPTTSMDKALSAISEVSQKFVGKIIIDTERRSMPINVDIQGMQWRDALESICRKSDLWYTEYENYLQITGSPGAPGTTSDLTSLQPGKGGATQGSRVAEIAREPVTFRSREIKVSAVFLEATLNRLEEVGINWSFMKSVGAGDGTVDFAVTTEMADKVSDKLFKAEVTPKISFANMSFIAQLFSNYALGEILSGPQLVVRSGEEGKIQVGQDFSIRERDFAGNLIDRFYNAGTIVRVKPQVVTEQGVNFIHMEVNVERSSVTPGQYTTIIDKTAAVTNVLLLDGEETIIGGLYSTTNNTVRQGVPFLKDLPWYVFGLRYLFGYDRDESVKKELIILLKAELVPTLQERITQKAKEDNIYGQWQQEQARRDEHMRGRRPGFVE
jgi:type IV pilus assembly protein PilQ